MAHVQFILHVQKLQIKCVTSYIRLFLSVESYVLPSKVKMYLAMGSCSEVQDGAFAAARDFDI